MAGTKKKYESVGELDQELQDALGKEVDLEALISFGQQTGEATPQEALSRLFCPNPGWSLRPQDPPEYTGHMPHPAELEEIRSEQIPVIPTHRVPPRSFIPPHIEDFWWFPLSTYESHSLRGTFRSMDGHRLRNGRLVPVRSVDMATFLSSIYQARHTAPAWVEVLVFSSGPEERPSLREPDSRYRIVVPPLQQFVVTYAIVTTKSDIPRGPDHPSWLKALVDRETARSPQHRT